MIEQGITTVASTISLKAGLTNVVETAYTFKDYLEMAYFVTGGPLLLIVAGFGLYQLKLMKEQTKTDKETREMNARREAIRLATEQCNYYLNNIDTHISTIDQEMSVREIKYLIHNRFLTYTIDNNNIIIENDDNRKLAFNLIFKKENFDLLTEIVNIIKKLEIFSSYFISEIADDDFAYQTVGEHFIEEVKKFLFLIVMEDESKKERKNKNLIKLFLLWNSRAEAKNIENEIDKTFEKIIEMREKKEQHTTRKIKPIGTY